MIRFDTPKGMTANTVLANIAMVAPKDQSGRMQWHLRMDAPDAWTLETYGERGGPEWLAGVRVLTLFLGYDPTKTGPTADANAA